MDSVRDQRLLIVTGIIALAVGGLAGVVGGVLVATGAIGPIRSYLSLPAGIQRGEWQGRSVFAEEAATIAVVRNASPAVVSIVARKTVQPQARGNYFELDDALEYGIPDASRAPNGTQTRIGGGSGFIVTSDGYIVTNRHVVADTAAAYTALLADNRELPVVVLDRDPIHDIAILKVEAGGVLPVLSFGNSDDAVIGETVIAIGYALSEFRNTVTKGVVSGVNRRVIASDGRGTSEAIFSAIQTDAAINPGNSGGPLLNLRGEVIGVNAAVSMEGQLVGFAIPARIAQEAVNSVASEGRIVRPWLGVRYAMLDVERTTGTAVETINGARVVAGILARDPAVVPGSPADRAGIAEGDIITAVDGTRVDIEMPLAMHIAKRRTGDIITLTVRRDSTERAVPVTLGEFPRN
ncbi:MAG: trypsin-like peptidase domain-containing protein [bacterium]|nr:trypsin-like peptidase domain-containing protein [bacterium]